MYYESNPSAVGVSEEADTESFETNAYVSSIEESDEDGEKISGEEAIVY